MRVLLIRVADQLATGRRRGKAVALSAGTLVTHDGAAFRRVRGLSVETWLA